ncbi:MAG TPA: hypothetical protein P5149_01525 [Candidatus Competibacteraceae bacterium]|nr:hypothetical protein [Candidatus Competibacteraceae bacterium]MCP5132403.1 hypothetical protein [Gammaproteobacteria bacterium]HPF57789.1 hypothetical protein [Candidatus Competibacteraceae bacterium]HRY17058.1 hypothetical protein [Candidatus Competibacteraceae bacterium]
MFNLKQISRWVLAAASLSLAVQAEEPKDVVAPANQAVTPEQPVTAAPATGQTASPEELKAALQERVKRYWAARQARDVRTLYELESAAQPGGWLKLEHAMSLQGLPVRSVKIDEVQVEGEKGMTQISAEVMIGTIGWTRQTTKDPWVLLDGQWYHETFR